MMSRVQESIRAGIGLDSRSVHQSRPRADCAVRNLGKNYWCGFFSSAVQSVSNVRGEEAFAGKELIRNLPTGATVYCVSAKLGAMIRVWNRERGALAFFF